MGCFSMICLLLVVIISDFALSVDPPYCMIDHDTPVAWWVLIKEHAGRGYYYLSSQDFAGLDLDKIKKLQWRTGKDVFENSPLSWTYEIRRFDKDVDIFAYNDQSGNELQIDLVDLPASIPKGGSAHEKGIVMAEIKGDINTRNGCWIQHSIPKYPDYADRLRPTGDHGEEGKKRKGKHSDDDNEEEKASKKRKGKQPAKKSETKRPQPKSSKHKRMLVEDITEADIKDLSRGASNVGGNAQHAFCFNIGNFREVLIFLSYIRVHVTIPSPLFVSRNSNTQTLPPSWTFSNVDLENAGCSMAAVNDHGTWPVLNFYKNTPEIQKGPLGNIIGVPSLAGMDLASGGMTDTTLYAKLGPNWEILTLPSTPGILPFIDWVDAVASDAKVLMAWTTQNSNDAIEYRRNNPNRVPRLTVDIKEIKIGKKSIINGNNHAKYGYELAVEPKFFCFAGNNRAPAQGGQNNMATCMKHDGLAYKMMQLTQGNPPPWKSVVSCKDDTKDQKTKSEDGKETTVKVHKVNFIDEF